MQSLFQLENDLNTGVFSVPVWSYVRDGLNANVTKVTDHYRIHPIPAKSSHLLTQIIQTVAISRNLPYDRFVANCAYRSMNVAQSLKLTSSLSKGKIWENQFFGGCEEIIIAHQSFFNIFEMRDNWRDACPVQILDHPQSNLNMWVPDGSVSSSEKGLAVIAINIPMLMAQYYFFCQQQDIEERSGRARRDIKHFVHSYPLTNALRSQTDIARLNALINYRNGVPSLPSLKKHSFFLTDYTNSLSTVMGQEDKHLTNTNKRIAGVMRQVPMVFSQNLWEMSDLPSMAPTVQCMWALAAARVKMLSFAVGINKNTAKQSQSELNRIQWQMRVQQTRNVLRNNLGLSSYYQLAPYLDKLGIS